jgi:hypothetical protein
MTYIVSIIIECRLHRLLLDTLDTSRLLLEKRVVVITRHLLSDMAKKVRVGYKDTTANEIVAVSCSNVIISYCSSCCCCCCRKPICCQCCQANTRNSCYLAWDWWRL